MSLNSTDWLTVRIAEAILNHMVEEHPERLDAVFHALADPTRRAMLLRLGQGEASVGDLAAPHPMSLAAASKHVRVLEEAGLIRRDVRGRVHVCRLDPAPMHAGREWIRHFERFWTERLDTLAALLAAEDDERGGHDGST